MRPGAGTLLLARPLRMLQLGDDTARGAGLAVERCRIGLIIVATMLAAVATAAAGPIQFVAFVAAPIARRLTRTASPSSRRAGRRPARRWWPTSSGAAPSHRWSCPSA